MYVSYDLRLDDVATVAFLEISGHSLVTRTGAVWVAGWFPYGYLVARVTL